MNEAAKKFLESSLYVIFFAAGVFAIRAYKENHATAPTPAANAQNIVNVSLSSS
jgi:hypothetical protein